MLEDVGCDPTTARLGDVFLQRPSVEVSGGRTLTAVSFHTQWESRSPLSMFLLSVASPDLILPASGVRTLSSVFRGLLVVCAVPLPADFIAALLAAGAKGVVCANATNANTSAWMLCNPEQCSAFFVEFYDALLGGAAVTASLQRAEEQFPMLRGAFSFCT